MKDRSGNAPTADGRSGSISAAASMATRRRKSSFAATQAEAIQLLRKLGGAEDERTVDGSRAPRVTGFTRPGPEQLHVLVQQQQPILRRSMVIACAVKADALDPPTLTIGELLHFARLL
ncbi:MAG TPA: hypothetical protein VFB92_23600 [Vicinamibacterales bacterium]|nr:hypothetical protein [Vicinamibacterales bacterium]